MTGSGKAWKVLMRAKYDLADSRARLHWLKARGGMLNTPIERGILEAEVSAAEGRVEAAAEDVRSWTTSGAGWHHAGAKLATDLSPQQVRTGMHRLYGGWSEPSHNLHWATDFYVEATYE